MIACFIQLVSITDTLFCLVANPISHFHNHCHHYGDSTLFLCPPKTFTPPPHPAVVPGGPSVKAAGREEGVRAGGSPQGARGEQHLQQEDRREAHPKDGGQQGEPGGPPECSKTTAA